MRTGNCPQHRPLAMPSMRFRWNSISCPSNTPPQSSGMQENAAAPSTISASRLRMRPRALVSQLKTSSTVSTAPSSAAYAAKSAENIPAPTLCTVMLRISAPSARSPAINSPLVESVSVKRQTDVPAPAARRHAPSWIKVCRPALTARSSMSAGESYSTITS